MSKPIEDATERCTGHILSGPRKGQPCGRKPTAGCTVCHSHGGNLPNVQRAGKERLVRTAAQRAALERLRNQQGQSSIPDVIAEMERLAAECIAFKDVCRERIDKLNEIRYKGNTGEQLRAEVAVYERGLDRCNAVLATCVKLNIAGKRAERDEAEILMFTSAIRNILSRLELTPQQKTWAVQIVPEELRAISAEVSA